MNQTVRRVFAFDTETFLIGPAVVAPPLVCLQRAMCDMPKDSAAAQALVAALVRCVQNRDRRRTIPRGVDVAVLSASVGVDEFIAAASQPDTVVVGHNLPFDLGVMCEESPRAAAVVRDLHHQGRAVCTMVRDQLVDIALGQFRSREEVDEETGLSTFVKVGYTLAEVAQRRLGLFMAKGTDTWRLRYGELQCIPVDQWPDEAYLYAQDDALVALAVFLSQWDQWPDIPCEDETNAAHWALHRTGVRGFAVDPDAVLTLDAHLKDEVRAARSQLADAGIYRQDGTKDTARIRQLVVAAYERRGADVPMTAGTEKSAPEVSTSRQVLLDAKDATLDALAAVGSKEKLLTSFVPKLVQGFRAPVVCRYHPLVESMRASCSEPNMMQLPRAPGVRECFVARPGFVLCSVDFDGAELRALSQVCIDVVGYSHMAEAFKRGEDPHLTFAAGMLGITYQEALDRLEAGDPVVKDARQRAKPPNFGFPGGLGVDKFREFARTQYKVVLTREEARDQRTAWGNQWPEVPEYQRTVAAHLDAVDGTMTHVHPRTGFVRGGVGYTQGCNQGFQHLVAAGAKRALVKLWDEGPDNGVFPVAFIHDEVIAEIPTTKVDHAAPWMAATMVRELQALCPDVPITAGPAIMRRWYKDAKERRDESGRLIPWEPKVKA